MSRSVLKIICTVSGILFGVLAVFLAVAVVQTLQAADTVGVSIIGGAGTPTVNFVLQQAVRTPVFYSAGAAFFLFSVTGLGLIITKKPRK